MAEENSAVSAAIDKINQAADSAVSRVNKAADDAVSNIKQKEINNSDNSNNGNIDSSSSLSTPSSPQSQIIHKAIGSPAHPIKDEPRSSIKIGDT